MRRLRLRGLVCRKRGPRLVVRVRMRVGRVGLLLSMDERMLLFLRAVLGHDSEHFQLCNSETEYDCELSTG